MPRVQLRVQGDDRLPAALQRGGDRGADLQGLQQEARRIDSLISYPSLQLYYHSMIFINPNKSQNE